jgi:uncharacterized membrane protein
MDLRITMKPFFAFASLFTTGIIAGLFFSWSVAVTPGLRKVDDEVFIISMKSMNQHIQNPFFFTSFFGALMFCIISAYLEFDKPIPTSWYWLLASVMIYGTGVLGVTIIGNVPLNIQLDNVDISVASSTEVKLARDNFEGLWTALNTIRTISACMVFGLQIIYCFTKR